MGRELGATFREYMDDAISVGEIGFYLIEACGKRPVSPR